MLVHQIIAEQTINFRSVDILKQIPDGTTVERPATNLSRRPTTITLTKNGNVWEPNASGTITGDGQAKIKVVKGRAVSGKLSGTLTQQAFSKLGITPQVKLSIPKGDPHNIKPETPYKRGRVTWLQYDAEGNATRKTGSLDQFDAEYKRRAKLNVSVGKQYASETYNLKQQTLRRSKWFRTSYMGLAWLAAGYTAYDMFGTYWNNTGDKKARLMYMVNDGYMDQQDFKIVYQQYKKEQLAILFSGVESVGVSLLVGAIVARVGTARALSVAAQIGRAGGKLPRFSLPTLIGWGIGVAATVGAEYLLGKMERDTFYQMFIDWAKGDDEAVGDQFDQSNLPADLPQHKPLSQEDMQELADSLKEKVKNKEINEPGVSDPKDVDRVMKNFRNLN